MSVRGSYSLTAARSTRRATLPDRRPAVGATCCLVLNLRMRLPAPVPRNADQDQATDQDSRAMLSTQMLVSR